MDILEQMSKMMATMELLQHMPNSANEFLEKIHNDKSKERKHAIKYAKEQKLDMETIELTSFCELLLDIATVLSDKNLIDINNMTPKENRLLALKLISESIEILSNKLK